MTEQEALKMLKGKLTCMTLEDLSCIKKGCDRDCDSCNYNYTQGTRGEQKESLELAIKALEEIQQYRAICTVEECREAVEKQRARKTIDDTEFGMCPRCHSEFNSELIEEYNVRYCLHCGQAIDWSEEDE